MKYILVEKPGGPENLRVAEGPQPIAGPGEVLIRVAAAGINRPDIAQREGKYPPPSGASPHLGLEVSGVVEACGPGVEATTFKVGDPVCALVNGGGYAEFCVAPAAQCLPIPRGLTMIEAAGIPETFFTVWANAFMRGKLASGENFLVHGGTSGIGTTAIQLAHSWGARVFATAGSDEKCQACLELGADHAINYKNADFVNEIKRLTEGRGVDLILDMVGGTYFERNLQALSLEGRLIQIAFLQGNQVNLNLGILMTRCLTLMGSTLRPRTTGEKEKIAKELYKNVWPLLESRKISVKVDHVFPLAEVSEAHRYLESGQHVGKVILVNEHLQNG